MDQKTRAPHTFSFTGITWQIDFSEMTYFSGDGFTLTLFGLGADKIEVIQPVSVAIDIEPEPARICSMRKATATSKSPSRELPVLM